jgi:two-component system OmpR family response regulator
VITEDATSTTVPAVNVHQVLIVEDEAETSEFVSLLLKKNGYDVITARNGGQAHSAFTLKKPDFVITDVMLPGETGFEICERFKQLDERVPVLILSAITLSDAKSLAVRVGADGYLTKPVEAHVLIDTIRRIADRNWIKHHTEEPAEKKRESVRFACQCGKRLKYRQAHRGKRHACPKCGRGYLVP